MLLKLARRKADELEQFGSSAPSTETTIPEAEIEAGVGLVEEMLEKWAQTAGDAMDIDDPSMEARYESELKQLEGCLKSYIPQLEKNRWVQEVLMNTY